MKISKSAAVAIGAWCGLAGLFVNACICVNVLTEPRWSFWNGVAQFFIIGAFVFTTSATLGLIAWATKEYIDDIY